MTQVHVRRIRRDGMLGVLASFVLLFAFSTVTAQEPEPQPEDGHRATTSWTSFEPPLRPFDPAYLSELTVPAGFEVSIFAQDLSNPRIMVYGDDGTLYVSQRIPGNVIALSDTDGDGVADGAPRVVASGIPLAHGLTVHDSHLYIAANKSIFRAVINADGSVGEPQVLVDNLPEAGQHSARTIGFGPDGLLYINIGSPCNVCINSIPEHATILRGPADFATRSVFASGLRHTIGFAWHPVTGQLWGLDHGIDTLGDDVPPEELNLLERGNNYGWPYCYGDNQANDFTDGYPPGRTREEFCADATAPTLPYQAHSAPIGFTFYTGSQFPADYSNDGFAVMRGSWNRNEATGFKVVRVLFDDNGQPTGFEDFMTDFLIEDGMAQFGRPAGIVVAPDGSLLVSEDSNNIIYRIAYTGN